MAYQPPERNYDGIEFENLRREVDPRFHEVSDALSRCYYDYWQHGQPAEFHCGRSAYNVRATPEESKHLYDDLTGLIWHHYELAIHKAAARFPMPADAWQRRVEIRDANNNVVHTTEALALLKIEELKQKGIELDL